MHKSKWVQLAIDFVEKRKIDLGLSKRYAEEGEECWICDETMTGEEIVTTLFGGAAHLDHFASKEEEE